MRPLTDYQKQMLKLCRTAQSTRDLVKKMGLSKDSVYSVADGLREKDLLRKDKMKDGSVMYLATQKPWPPRKPRKISEWDGPIVCGVRL